MLHQYQTKPSNRCHNTFIPYSHVKKILTWTKTKLQYQWSWTSVEQFGHHPYDYVWSPEICTLSEGGVGVLHWDKSVCKVLCEVLVAVSGLFYCEGLPCRAAYVLLWNAQTWEEQNAQRDPQNKKKNKHKNTLSMWTGMNCKLEENFKMTGEIIKLDLLN